MSLIDWFRPRDWETRVSYAGRDGRVVLGQDGPPFRTDKCPACGGEYFTAGGPVTTHSSNGVAAQLTQSSAVLSCLGCGERFYGTKDGLRRPHEAALPPAWALTDLQARMAKAQDAAAQARKESVAEANRKPKPSRTEFRTPPKPE